MHDYALSELPVMYKLLVFLSVKTCSTTIPLQGINIVLRRVVKSPEQGYKIREKIGRDYTAGF